MCCIVPNITLSLSCQVDFRGNNKSDYEHREYTKPDEERDT